MLSNILIGLTSNQHIKQIPTNSLSSESYSLCMWQRHYLYIFYWITSVQWRNSYFPPVTNILFEVLAKATQYVVPALSIAAGAPQIASFLATSHITTLKKKMSMLLRICFVQEMLIAFFLHLNTRLCLF